MKEYIKYETDGLKCNHPKVEKFWEHGGGPSNGPFYHYVSVRLEDGSEHEFKATGDNIGDAISSCNLFLNTINE
jgi:hypothetical protein